MKISVRLCMVAAFSLLFVTSAGAELKLTGSMDNMQADITNFPPDMKSAYALFAVKCSKCHRLERTLTSVKTGVTPSMTMFDYRGIDAYANKMRRKSEFDMTKDEVQTVVKLLRFMVKEATH